jgi:hypothetical protein
METVSFGMPSLWSPGIKAGTRSPKQILQVQANALRDQTNGILIGLLETLNEGESFVHILYIFAPVIDYRHCLLKAIHSKTMYYPVTLESEAMEESHNQPGNPITPISYHEADFIHLLGKILGSHNVVSIAQSLLARSSEA